MVLTLGDRISVLRKQAKLSRAELAKLTGFTEDEFHAIEADVFIPSFPQTIVIANALNISLDFLAGRIEQKIDTQWLDRLGDIQAMNEKNKRIVVEMLDAFLQYDKVKDIYTPKDTAVKIKRKLAY